MNVYESREDRLLYNVRIHTWRTRTGLLHRDVLPAVIHYQQAKKTKQYVVYEKWYRLGVVHRDNGPAEIHYAHGVPRSDKGRGKNRIIQRTWYQNGLIHREDGHAIERENKSTLHAMHGGLFDKDIYVLYGQYMREDIFEEALKLQYTDRLLYLARISRNFDYYANLLEPTHPELAISLRAYAALS